MRLLHEIRDQWRAIAAFLFVVIAVQILAILLK
jgi:hypothetical protein